MLLAPCNAAGTVGPARSSPTGQHLALCGARLQRRGTTQALLNGLRVQSPFSRRNACCRRGASRGRPQTVTLALLDVDEATFEQEVLQSEKPVLVDFWAHWCGPCKLIAPLLSTLEKDYQDALKIVKVEADPCPTLMERYKVYGLPTIMMFKGGKKVEGSHREGAIGKQQLLKYLETHGIASVAAKS